MTQNQEESNTFKEFKKIKQLTDEQISSAKLEYLTQERDSVEKLFDEIISTKETVPILKYLQKINREVYSRKPKRAVSTTPKKLEHCLMNEAHLALHI